MILSVFAFAWNTELKLWCFVCVFISLINKVVAFSFSRDTGYFDDGIK